MSRDAAEVFTEFYSANYARVLRFLERRVSDPETARELAGDTFRIAWSRFSLAEPPTLAWIFAVARNVVGDEYRRRERHGAAMQRLGTELAVARDTHATDVSAVHAALSQLGDDQAEVLRLAYWEQLKGAEIATILGISVSAVWVRLHRARRAFSQTLSTVDSPSDDFPSGVLDHEQRR